MRANDQRIVREDRFRSSTSVQIEAAGFALVGTSEINANPRDTKDDPNGVWSLAPSFQSGTDYGPADAQERARYAPVGESDRMTLKLVRLAEGAARPSGSLVRIVRSPAP